MRLAEARSAHPAETWVLYFRTTRKGLRQTGGEQLAIGLVRDLPDKRTAWAEVERLDLPINPIDSRQGVTFADLALHLLRTRIGGAFRIYPPKSAYHHKRLRASPSKPLAPRLGYQNRAWYRTAGNRGLTHDCEEGRRACESDARANATCHVDGLSP